MRRAVLALALLVPGLALADLATQSPTSASGVGWSSSVLFDGDTAGEAFISLAPSATGTLNGGNLGFDAIPVGAIITQIRSRVFWRSSLCTNGGIDITWQLNSGGVKGGGGVEECKTTGGWTDWYTSTGSWTRDELLNGVLFLQVVAHNANSTGLSRTAFVAAGEVEVTYTPSASTPRVHVGMWSVRLDLQPASSK